MTIFIKAYGRNNLKSNDFHIELFRRIAEDDDQLALKQLFQEFFSGMVNFADSMIGDVQKSQELVQDVFLKIWSDRKNLTSVTKCSCFLYVMLKNKCIDHLRSNNRRSRLFSSFETDNDFNYLDTEAKVKDHELVKVVGSAINSLPEKCRLVFRLVKDEGLKYREVSELLGVSIKTVEAHMQLAYKRLIRFLDEHFPEYSEKNEKSK